MFLLPLFRTVMLLLTIYRLNDIAIASVIFVVVVSVDVVVVIYDRI